MCAAETWQKRYWVNTATNYLRVVLRLGGGIVLFRLTYQYLERDAFGHQRLRSFVNGSGRVACGHREDRLRFLFADDGAAPTASALRRS